MTNYFLEKKLNIELPIWTILCPVIATILLGVQTQLPDNLLITIITAISLISAVLSAVHHAEVIAHRVGEPYGTLILALAITIIEVALIVSLMLTENTDGPSVLARDTVFAAIMIILTGIIGLCLYIGGLRFKEQVFIKQGVNSALITLIAISLLTLVLPNFTVSGEHGQYTPSQLIFVAIQSLILYGGFIAMQTVRYRNYFLPESECPTQILKVEDQELENTYEHVMPPNNRTTIASLLVLMLALVAVVLLSKVLSPTIEAGVEAIGAPQSLVGIIIATVILLPEGLAAIKAVRSNRLQTSLNLALGSALASIGLTIPAVAITCYFTGLEITLGLNGVSTLLLILSLFIISISFNTNKTNIQQGIVLLVIFMTYIFTTIVP